MWSWKSLEQVSLEWIGVKWFWDLIRVKMVADYLFICCDLHYLWLERERYILVLFLCCWDFFVRSSRNVVIDLVKLKMYEIRCYVTWTCSTKVQLSFLQFLDFGIVCELYYGINVWIVCMTLNHVWTINTNWKGVCFLWHGRVWMDWSFGC